MSTRADRKADYQAYRAAALTAAEGREFPPTEDGMRVEVEATAGVSLCEDGAYVDAVIWVPRRVMEKQR